MYSANARTRAADGHLGAPEGFDDDAPDWLPEARSALVFDGEYLAYEDHEADRVVVVTLQPGWTRVGRGLGAHVALTDPTVSRRHALIHRDHGHVRIVDDHSLNGVFVNGEPVDWHELSDGDVIDVGSFRIHFISLLGAPAQAAAELGAQWPGSNTTPAASPVEGE